MQPKVKGLFPRKPLEMLMAEHLVGLCPHSLVTQDFPECESMKFVQGIGMRSHWLIRIDLSDQRKPILGVPR